MKMGTVLAVVVAVVSGVGALAAAPTGAQEGGEGGATGYPSGGRPPPPPPDYAYRNGEVHVDGDEVLDCRTFAESFDGGYDEFGDRAQAGRALERRRRAGSPSGSTPPEVRAEVRGDRRAEQLPETGGVPALPPAAGLLLLTGAGFLVLRGRTG